MTITHTNFAETTTVYPTRTFSNYGPLTTTFTPAPSCATATNAIVVGHLYKSSRGSSFSLDAYPTCSIQSYDDSCYPSAAQWYSDNKDLYKTTTPVAHYYSPGIYCPESWTEAGSIIAPISKNHTTEHAVEWGPLYENTDWLSLLMPSNTLRMCCPNQFTGDINGGCYSTISSKTSWNLETVLGQTELCAYRTPEEDIVTVFATTALESVPSPVWSVTRVVSVTEIQEIEPTTVPVKQYYYDEVVTYIPAVMLMHAPSDLPNAAPTNAQSSVYILLLLCLLTILA